MKIKLGVLGASLVVVASGCGSSSTPGNSITTACTDVAMARCDLASSCTVADNQAGTGFNILENYGDMQTCVTRQTLNCTNALNAPDNGNNPAEVEMCVAALEGQSCAAFFDNMPPMTCTPIGPRAAGASCTFNGQCMSASCNGTKNSLCGTCGSPAATGTDCSGSACAQGDRCLAASNTCAAIVPVNGACDSTHPCDRGYSCVGDNPKTNTMGTCEPASTSVGAPCGGTTMAGCDPTRGLYCGGPTGSKTCMRVIYPSYNGTVTDGGAMASDGGTSGTVQTTPAGTPCGLLADGSRVGCVAGGCYTATGLATGSDLGTCKPFAADKAPCDTTLGPGCMAPARCVVSGGDGGTAGTCLVPGTVSCP